MYLSLSQLSVLTAPHPSSLIHLLTIVWLSTLFPLLHFTYPSHCTQPGQSQFQDSAHVPPSGWVAERLVAPIIFSLPLSHRLSWALGTQPESTSQPCLPRSVDMWLCGGQPELRWIDVYNFENMPLKKKAEVWTYQRWKASREETEQEDRGIGLSWFPRAELPTFK